MSTYTDASLIYYPSGYKESKAYSLKPTDGSGDLTFTRASSATRVNESGLIESVATGVPRIDYTGGGCGKLLLESQRTNLALYSEQFDNAAWTKASSTITSNVAISPSGYQDADNWVGTAANLYRSGTAGVEYTISVYVKSNGQSKDNFVLRLGNSISTTFTATSEWQRFSFTGTPTTTLFGITTASAPNNSVDILVWGFQMEANSSYPTSYIPTTTTAVTRVADSASKSGISSLINSEEGVLYVEIAALAEDSDSKRITISDGTIANRITISVSGNVVSGFINVNNANQYNFYESNQNVLSTIKIAVKYKANDFAAWINGNEYDSSISGNTFVSETLNKLSFDSAVGVNNFYGNVQNVMIFPSALSDTDLAALTTL